MEGGKSGRRKEATRAPPRASSPLRSRVTSHASPLAPSPVPSPARIRHPPSPIPPYSPSQRLCQPRRRPYRRNPSRVKHFRRRPAILRFWTRTCVFGHPFPRLCCAASRAPSPPRPNIWITHLRRPGPFSAPAPAPRPQAQHPLAPRVTPPLPAMRAAAPFAPRHHPQSRIHHPALRIQYPPNHKTPTTTSTTVSSSSQPARMTHHESPLTLALTSAPRYPKLSMAVQRGRWDLEAEAEAQELSRGIPIITSEADSDGR
jgi:hypothetical protein